MEQLPSVFQAHIEAAVRCGDLFNCLICQGEPEVVGMFVPSCPEFYGAPLGKTRIMFYLVCEDCMAQSDFDNKRDKCIERQMAVSLH